MGQQARNYTGKTIKRLFALSGNRCSYPNCNAILVNQNHAKASNICHIEAANEGGERYNPDMTDKQRADYDNLIVLCRQHHDETDDVTRYSVQFLKEMKQNHENMIASQLYTAKEKIQDIQTLNIFMKYLHFHHLEYYVIDLPNKVNAYFFELNKKFDDFKRYRRCCYPFNDNELNNIFDLFLKKYFSLVSIILDKTSDINTSYKYNNFDYMDSQYSMQMNKQYLTHDNIVSLCNKIEISKNEFINIYIKFSNFLRVYYKEVDIY